MIVPNLTWETIQGNPPAKSNSYRIRGNMLYKTKEMKDYEKNFLLQCVKYRNKNISKEFGINLMVYYPSKRADLDNSLKATLDLLQKAKAIQNDRLCVQIFAMRYIDKLNPRIEFAITEK